MFLTWNICFPFRGGSAGSPPWAPQAVTSCLTISINKVGLKAHQSSILLPERNAKRMKIKSEILATGGQQQRALQVSHTIGPGDSYSRGGPFCQTVHVSGEWDSELALFQEIPVFQVTSRQRAVLKGREGGEQRRCKCKVQSADHPLLCLRAPVHWANGGAAPASTEGLLKTETPPSAVARGERGLILNAPGLSAFSKGTE